jgi:hypothetical protein
MRRLWSRLLKLLICLPVALIIAAWPGSSTFTVGTESTYITEPLDKDGYPDYVTALNQRLRKDITPQNNANVLIWQAIGPRPEGAALPDEYFQWLGIEPPPEEGEYFVWWDKYRKRHSKANLEVQLGRPSELPDDLPNRPWSAKDLPEVADWLQQNEKPLAVMIEATRRPEYFNPHVARSTENTVPILLNALLPSTQKCREIASALVTRAMLRVSEGKFDEAWQDLLACHRLGRMMGHGTLVELLVGIAIEGVASKADVEFIDHSNLTTKQLLACLEDVRKLPPMPAVAECLNVGERFMLLDTIMLMAHHGTGALEGVTKPQSTPRKGNQFTSRLFTHSINWDPGLRNANRWINRYVEALDIKDHSARMRETAQINKEVKELRTRVSAAGWIQQIFMGADSRGERMGDIMIGLMLPAVDKIASSADRIDQVQRNLHLAFALAAYHSDRGRYPARLDELAPNYLERIPDDLFSGTTLIYRPAADGYLLYSVGPNGVDDGGRGYDDQPRGDDVSVRIPVPAPKKEEN